MFAVAWHTAATLFPTIVRGLQSREQQREQQQTQHQYTLLQGRAQLGRQFEEQSYINELRKDFFEFETNLQRESEAIRFGRQLKMQIDADLARRFTENSPFLDALEDLRRQLFEIYADEQKPLMLIAPFWDESQPNAVGDAGGLAQMRTAITRAWQDAEWSDNFVMLDGYFKRPLRHADRDVRLIKDVLSDLPVVLVHGYLNGDSAFPMISTWNVMPGERIGRIANIRGQGHSPEDGGKLTQNTFRTQVGESISQVAGLLGEAYHFYASGREPRLDLFTNQNPFGEAVTRQWVEGLRLLNSTADVEKNDKVAGVVESSTVKRAGDNGGIDIPIRYKAYQRQFETDPTLIIPGYGAHSIRIGMHRSVVERRLGKADREQDARDSPYFLSYFREGVSFYFEKADVVPSTTVAF